MFFDGVHPKVEGLEGVFWIACFHEDIGDRGVDIEPFGGDLHGVLKRQDGIAVLSEVGLGHPKGIIGVIAFGIELGGLLQEGDGLGVVVGCSQTSAIIVLSEVVFGAEDRALFERAEGFGQIALGLTEQTAQGVKLRMFGFHAFDAHQKGFGVCGLVDKEGRTGEGQQRGDIGWIFFDDFEVHLGGFGDLALVEQDIALSQKGLKIDPFGLCGLQKECAGFGGIAFFEFGLCLSFESLVVRHDQPPASVGGRKECSVGIMPHNGGCVQEKR